MRARFIAALLLLLAAAGLPAPAASLGHRVELELSPASGEIRIRDRVRVEGLEQFRFVLAAWLARVEVAVDGRPVELRRADGEYSFDLPDDGAHEVEFDLGGRIPARDAANAGDAGSSHGADGVYLPGYDRWLPHPRGSPISYRLTLSVPAAQRAVVTAELVDEQIVDGVYRATFSGARAREAPSLFSGPYEVRERLDGGPRIRSYFHPGLESYADTYLDAAAGYIRRYQVLIGDYPYGEFYIVSAPLPVGLGFPGLTYVDRRILPLPFMQTRSLAHEVLHNWWGNAVAVDYGSGNWAEGLTTYQADYALERDKGAAGARAMRVKWLRDYAALPAARDRPVREFTSKQHQASQVIGYNKVAFIFHMLQQEIGEQAFDRGIRRFWLDRRFGTASWADLQAAFEASSGRDLDWFFRQWLERAGAPRLSLGAHSVTRTDEGYLTRIEILQPVAGYRLRLPVSLETGQGSERREIVVDSTRTSLEWVTPEQPRAIHVDPDSDVFRRLQRSETPPILRDITLDPNTQTLIASDAGDFADTARALAGRVLDTPPNFVASIRARASQRPLLLITPRSRLAGQLDGLGLQIPPELPSLNYRAAAWTARLGNTTPVLIVSAESAAQLQALLRPLPHYGGQSYVLFDDGRAQASGLWPLARGSLYRDLRAAQ